MMVDRNVDKKGTRKVAEAFLQFLYTPEAQTIIARHHYRPSKPETVSDKALVDSLPKVTLFTIDKVFGGWAKAQPAHFGSGGIFDSFAKAPR